MNALEKMDWLYNNGLKPKNRLLLIAYLQLHIENPGLHPDDYLCVDGGYCGYQVVLVHEVLKTFPDIPSSIQYPYNFLKLVSLLNDVELDDNVQVVKDFLAYMDTKNLHLVTESLTKLHLQVSDENQSYEEELSTSSDILRDCADSILWIARQK